MNAVDWSDTAQAANLIIYSIGLFIAVRRRMWRAECLAVFVFIVHSVIFYAAVLLQHGGFIYGLPLHEWGIALRFHLGIMLIGYLVIAND